MNTLGAVRDNSWAKAPCSSEATLALMPRTLPGGEETLVETGGSRLQGEGQLPLWEAKKRCQLSW